MAQLNILPPLISQTQQAFNESSSASLTAIQDWSSLISSLILVDYLQDSNNNFQNENFTYAGSAFQAIPNFTFNFIPRNPVSILNMKLTLQGVGVIGIFINDLLFREIPFSNAAFAAVDYNRQEVFPTNGCKVSIYLRSLGGDVVLASSKAQAFLNYVQVTNINS